MPSIFFHKKDAEKQKEDSGLSEVVLMINKDKQVCIVTHDTEYENFTHIAYTQATEQLCIFSEENPCGELLDYPIHEKFKPFVLPATEILYVNFNSDTNSIIQELWLPLRTIQ